ncbi:MAG: PLD nuclease N-terminal domain-containing protein [Micrococcales bacterium]|nr:PLD nuclease N-terminal domain-containing protein [Micrococcales bacterium]
MVRIVFVFVLPAALLLYALIDCVQDDEVERTSVPKLAWIAMIVLLTPYVGAIAWLLVAKIAKPRRPRPRRPAAPLAPDDDPEFLRRIAEQQRKNRKPNGGQGGSGQGDK